MARMFSVAVGAKSLLTSVVNSDLLTAHGQELRDWVVYAHLCRVGAVSCGFCIRFFVDVGVFRDVAENLSID